MIIDTPLDIGWARANWVPSIGLAFTEDLTNADPEAELSSARAKQQSGQAEIFSFSLGQGSTYITNNVPYVTRLNEGSSKQAPAGFVQQAIVKAARTI